MEWIKNIIKLHSFRINIILNVVYGQVSNPERLIYIFFFIYKVVDN